jgi:hypothetical protein
VLFGLVQAAGHGCNQQQHVHSDKSGSKAAGNARMRPASLQDSVRSMNKHGCNIKMLLVCSQLGSY